MASVLRRRDTDMTSGNIPRLLLAFALPLLIGNIFQQLYNTVDSIVVGNGSSYDASYGVITRSILLCGSITAIWNWLPPCSV